MKNDLVKQRLIRNPFFSGLPPELLENIIGESRKIQARDGDLLFSANDDADSFFYVIKGWVRLFFVNSAGEKTVILVATAGEIFAEASALGEGRKYPATAQCVGECTLLAIPREAFTKRISGDQNLSLHILSAVSAGQHDLIRKIEQAVAKDAPQKIGVFLLRLCCGQKEGPVTLDLPRDKSLVPFRLNITQDVFAAALKKLESYGVIPDGDTIIVQALDTLARFCGVEDRAALC